MKVLLLSPTTVKVLVFLFKRNVYRILNNQIYVHMLFKFERVLKLIIVLFLNI